MLGTINGDLGFGHFPYEVEVTMEPCGIEGDGASINAPAVSSNAAPFDKTDTSIAFNSASVQAGRVRSSSFTYLLSYKNVDHFVGPNLGS